MKKQTILMYALAMSLTANGAMVIMSWSTWFPAEQSKKKMMQRKPSLVKIAKVKQEPIALKKTFSGVLRASQSVGLSSLISGRIAKILVKIGQQVKKGDILVELDRLAAQAEVNANKARMDHARQVFLSMEKLAHIRGRIEVEKARADWAVAKAEYEKAKVSLEYTFIRAPFDGEVGFIPVSEGAMIEPRQELAKLVSSRPMRVEFDVGEADAKYITKNQEVDVLVPDLDPLPETARVMGVQPYSDTLAHTVRVLASFPNEKGRFRDGSYAKITASLSSDDQALVVPREAVLLENDQYFVFVVPAERGVQKVRKVPVIIGMKEDERVQIEEGVEVDMIVVTDPVDTLVDGLPVRIEGGDTSPDVSAHEPQEEANEDE